MVLLLIIILVSIIVVSIWWVVHIIICLGDVEILLCIVCVVIDCCVLVIMIFYFNLRCWLITLSIWVSLWTFALAIVWILLEDTHSRTWRSKHSIICEEVMEVATQVRNHTHELFVIGIFHVVISKGKRSNILLVLIWIFHFFLNLFFFRNQILFWFICWTIIIQKVERKQWVLLFNVSLAKFNVILIFYFDSLDFLIIISIWLLILLNNLFLNVTTQCFSFIFLHSTNGNIFLWRARTWTL